MLSAQATRAYGAASAHRSVREQEADVFGRATAALRKAKSSGNLIARVRALADNDLLWLTVLNLLHDPGNQLPCELRAAIISIGLAVQREIQSDTPDFDFLITVNDNIAGGLSGRPA